jgi:hypothetical protein
METDEPVEAEDMEKATRQPTVESLGEPYSIYTHRQKIGIIFTASFVSILSPMGSNIFIPAFNSVASDLHVSASMVNLTLTTYLVSLALATKLGQADCLDFSRHSSDVCWWILRLGRSATSISNMLGHLSGSVYWTGALRLLRRVAGSTGSPVSRQQRHRRTR